MTTNVNINEVTTQVEIGGNTVDIELAKVLIVTNPTAGVISVNGENGVVTLNQDQVLDGTTYKQYSQTDKTKLAGIQAGAEVNVNADWNSVSGDSQILNKPFIPPTLKKEILIGASEADYILAPNSDITSTLQTIIDTYKSVSVVFKNNNGANVTYIWGSNLLRNANQKIKIELQAGVTLKRQDNLNFPCLTSRSTPKGVSPVWVTQDYIELTGEGTFDFNSDNQSEKDWVGVDISHYNAEQSFGSSASKNYLTGATKGVTNMAHGTLYVHDTKIINSGFNGLGVGSGRPAGTGQGAIFYRDGQKFIWNNVITDNTDAPFSLSRVDLAVVSNSVNTNYNFDGGYAALCGRVYFKNFVNKGQGTPLALYNNYLVDVDGLDHQALIYTVTQVTDNSNFRIDCELTDTDRLKGKRLVFTSTQAFTEMGYNITQTSINTGVKYEITAYNGTTKQVTLDIPTTNTINVGDKCIISTDGLKISLESGLTLESEFVRMRNVTVRGINSVDAISKAGIVIDTGTKEVELENVKSLGSFEYGLFVGNVPSLTATNLEVNGSGLSGIVDNANGAIYDIPRLKNNGLRTTGDDDAIRLNQPNTIIINPQITDTRGTGFKTQQKAIRGFGSVDNIFVYGGNVAGNADNEPVSFPTNSRNTISVVGGVNGVRPFTQTFAGGGVLTLNRQNGNPQAITLNSNTSQLKIRPGQAIGDTLMIIFKQDATGGRVITSYDTTPVSGTTGNGPIKWAGDPFTLSTAANAVDTLVLRWGEDRQNWYEVNRNKSTTNFPYSTLALTGAISASNLSGTNTGDQTLNSLLPTQTGNGGKVLQTDGTDTSWQTASGGSGIVRITNSINTNTTLPAVANTDYVYLVSGTTTATLPTAVGNTNKYEIKNTGVNTVTIATTSGQTIDGSTTANLTPNTSLTLISNNSNWFII